MLSIVSTEEKPCFFQQNIFGKKIECLSFSDTFLDISWFSLLNVSWGLERNKIDTANGRTTKAWPYFLGLDLERQFRFHFRSSSGGRLSTFAGKIFHGQKILEAERITLILDHFFSKFQPRVFFHLRIGSFLTQRTFEGRKAISFHFGLIAVRRTKLLP